MDYYQPSLIPPIPSDKWSANPCREGNHMIEWRYREAHGQPYERGFCQKCKSTFYREVPQK